MIVHNFDASGQPGLHLIDSHCHLDDDRFDSERESIIERAINQGIRQFIVPATTANRWQKIRRITGQYNCLFPAYGLHPMFMSEHCKKHLDELDVWLDTEDPIALGECGLDFYRFDDEAFQLELFKAQLALAKNHGLPVIIHARKAMDRVISILRKVGLDTGGVIHSFAGSLQQAQQLFDLGYKLGIAATVDFERAKKLRSVVAGIDACALLLESDAPDQPGINHRGELNEPSFIVEHFRTMARLRGIDESRLAETLVRNTRELFVKLPQ